MFVSHCYYFHHYETTAAAAGAGAIVLFTFMFRTRLFSRNNINIEWDRFRATLTHSTIPQYTTI